MRGFFAALRMTSRVQRMACRMRRLVVPGLDGLVGLRGAADI
jgi:hypothetical protein